jgi:hypothetical protein
MRTKWIFLILSAIFLMTSISCGGAVIRKDEISCRPASAVSASATGKGKITIAWDLNEADKPAGFRIFYGFAPRKYKECVDVGKPSESSPGVMKHTLIGLETGEKYYIAVIAYDKNNSESDFSSEVSTVAE